MRWFIAALVVAASIAPGAEAQESVDVQIGKFVAFVDGQTAEATLTITCNGTVLEAFAYVVQRDHNSDFAALSPICDGATRSYSVSIQATEGERFRRGQARVSAFVLLESGESASPSRFVVIR